MELHPGVSVQTKGVFYAQPKHLRPPGAQPLFLEISGPTKQSVEEAKKTCYKTVEETAKKTLQYGMGSGSLKTLWSNRNSVYDASQLRSSKRHKHNGGLWDFRR